MEKLKLNKKGNVSSKIETLIGALLVIVILVALAPTMFQGFGGGATGLANSSVSGTAMPAWLPTTLAVIVAIGLVYLVYRALINKK